MVYKQQKLGVNMNYRELDEYIDEYGNDNETGIEDISIAMNVNKIRKDKEKWQQYMK